MFILMYTKIDDMRHAHKVNKILQAIPTLTRKGITNITGLCDKRLIFLHKVGLINIQHTYRRNHGQRTTENHTQI
jgi:hypothetical protein